jgi:hypothetical protein
MCKLYEEHVKGNVYAGTVQEGREREFMYSSTLFFISMLDGDSWLASFPGHFTSSEETRFPLYRRLGGPQGQSAGAENLAPAGI